jgi:hypothetical protein
MDLSGLGDEDEWVVLEEEKRNRVVKKYLVKSRNSGEG